MSSLSLFETEAGGREGMENIGEWELIHFVPPRFVSIDCVNGHTPSCGAKFVYGEALCCSLFLLRFSGIPTNEGTSSLLRLALTRIHLSLSLLLGAAKEEKTMGGFADYKRAKAHFAFPIRVSLHYPSLILLRVFALPIPVPAC